MASDLGVVVTLADWAGRFGGDVDHEDHFRFTFPNVPDAVRFAALIAGRPEWQVDLAEPATSLHRPCQVVVTVP